MDSGFKGYLDLTGKVERLKKVYVCELLCVNLFLSTFLAFIYSMYLLLLTKRSNNVFLKVHFCL